MDIVIYMYIRTYDVHGIISPRLLVHIPAGLPPHNVHMAIPVRDNQSTFVISCLVLAGDIVFRRSYRLLIDSFLWASAPCHARAPVLHVLGESSFE